MADYYSKKWKNAFDKFRQSVEKNLEEIRQQKADMQQMMLEFEHIVKGKYIHDNKRIVISAPEIIIGNVDYNGVLKGDEAYSHVLIRSNKMDLEASSPAGSTSIGSITQRASLIQTIAVDPGIDGKESVVAETSAIIQQARSISLNSNNTNDTFTITYAIPDSGIILNSDSTVSISSLPSVALRNGQVKNSIGTLQTIKKQLQEAISAQKEVVDDLLQKIDNCFDKQHQIKYEDIICSTSIHEIHETNNDLEKFQSWLQPAITEYFSLISKLAEVNRQIRGLSEVTKEIADKRGEFKTKSNGSRVSIAGEIIDLVSIDGDGNLRTNPEAAVNIQAQTVNIESKNKDHALMEKGNVRINTRTIDLSTADTQIKDETNRTNPAVGDINIVSKNINMEGVDYETKDGTQKIKGLTKEGKFSLRIENVEINAVDEQGKAAGHLGLNAKDIEIKSMDVEQESMNDKQIAMESKILLLSEKIQQGAANADSRSKQVQISADQMAIFAASTAEIQQKSALLQFDSGNISISSENNNLFGKTTFNGKSEFKGEVEAAKASINNIEAKSSFKSTNISDGIATPVAPSTATLNAKIEQEF